MEEGSDEIALIASGADRRAVLMFAHASLLGVVTGVSFLGLAVLLLLRPVGRRTKLKSYLIDASHTRQARGLKPPSRTSSVHTRAQWVDPRGRYPNSWRRLIAQLQGLVVDVTPGR
jgi:hypothetical protein